MEFAGIISLNGRRMDRGPLKKCVLSYTLFHELTSAKSLIRSA